MIQNQYSKEATVAEDIQIHNSSLILCLGIPVDAICFEDWFGGTSRKGGCHPLGDSTWQLLQPAVESLGWHWLRHFFTSTKERRKCFSHLIAALFVALQAAFSLDECLLIGDS